MVVELNHPGEEVIFQTSSAQVDPAQDIDEEVVEKEEYMDEEEEEQEEVKSMRPVQIVKCDNLRVTTKCFGIVFWYKKTNKDPMESCTHTKDSDNPSTSNNKDNVMKATTVSQFEKLIEDLKCFIPKAHEWLQKIPPSSWARKGLCLEMVLEIKKIISKGLIMVDNLIAIKREKRWAYVIMEWFRKGMFRVEFFEGWKPLSPLQLAVEEVTSE
ncbi:hypothetical protein Tco_0694320 [Tanacetum coccineum]